MKCPSCDKGKLNRRSGNDKKIQCDSCGRSFAFVEEEKLHRQSDGILDTSVVKTNAIAGENNNRGIR